MPAPVLRLPRIGTEPQRALGDLGNEVQRALTAVYGQAIVDGALVTGQECQFDAAGNPTDTPVVGGLGRPPRGFIVVGRRDRFDLWTSRSKNPSPNSLLLSHNAAKGNFATFDLWVF